MYLGFIGPLLPICCFGWAKRCQRLLQDEIVDIQVNRLELDEMWGFVGCREAQKPYSQTYRLDPFAGDIYLFIAFDPETRLVPAYVVGRRDVMAATAFIHRLRRAVSFENRPLLCTDGWSGYQETIPVLLGEEMDWAVVYKQYGAQDQDDRRYSPGTRCTWMEKVIGTGDPDLPMAGTSQVERCNLTVRTLQKRYARLSLAFSKKLGNLQAAVALHFAYYNFCWFPRTLGGITPAMAADVSHVPCDIADLVGDC